MPNFWRRSRRRIRGLRKMSWSDRALALESLAMLAAARILVKTSPEKGLIQRMGGATPSTESSPASLPSSLPASQTRLQGTGARVGKMLERAASITWWRSMCLEKALAGKWMLRRRGIPSTMYVGMARQGEGFTAHAWLVGEGQILTGAGKTVYATLAAFREPAKSPAPAQKSGIL